MIIDLVLLAVVGIVAWCVVGEGPWGGAITFLSVVFAGLLAMNFFEPVASIVEGFGIAAYADLLSLLGLFVILVSVCRVVADHLSPTSIELDGLVYQGSQWLFALATGYVTMAILLTALHTAPLPREFLDFTPERMNLFGIAAPDRQWLGFTQHVSEKVFRSGRVFDGATQVPGTVEQRYWPSFAIRYATRREQYARAGAAASAPADLVVPQTTPGGNTGGSSASF